MKYRPNYSKYRLKNPKVCFHNKKFSLLGFFVKYENATRGEGIKFMFSILCFFPLKLLKINSQVFSSDGHIEKLPTCHGAIL